MTVLSLFPGWINEVICSDGWLVALWTDSPPLVSPHLGKLWDTFTLSVINWMLHCERLPSKQQRLSWRSGCGGGFQCNRLTATFTSLRSWISSMRLKRRARWRPHKGLITSGWCIAEQTLWSLPQWNPGCRGHCEEWKGPGVLQKNSFRTFSPAAWLEKYGHCGESRPEMEIGRGRRKMTVMMRGAGGLVLPGSRCCIALIHFIFWGITKRGIPPNSKYSDNYSADAQKDKEHFHGPDSCRCSGLCEPHWPEGSLHHWNCRIASWPWLFGPNRVCHKALSGSLVASCRLVSQPMRRKTSSLMVLFLH